MHRNEKVLKHVSRDGYGVEIGPSHNPIAPKREGYKTHIIDHASQEQLRIKYEQHQVNLDNIEEVDFVWQGGSYSDLVGKKKHYDWIIASHVIEHTPDLISFLQDCDSILKDDGVLSLVIPDKRYCFDRYRPVTGIAKVIDSYYSKNTIHSAGNVAEYFLNVVSKGGNIAWAQGINGEYKCVHSIENALTGIQAVNTQKAYLDIHAWCFVPSSFRLMMQDLFNLGYTAFQELDYFPTDGCEFYMTLSRKGRGLIQPRVEMLQQIERELQQQ
jgi:predicted SAM-dependent methyltransferase